MRLPYLIAAVAAAGLVAGDAADAQKRKTPYWASISAGQARMRTGPGRNYPVDWLYQRAGLPVKVTDVYKEWRKVEDPGGTSGWMQGNLLTDKRTAFVLDPIVELRDKPNASAKVLWRAEKNVVGAISKCSSGWCWFDVRGRGGYVEAIHLFGVDPSEELP